MRVAIDDNWSVYQKGEKVYGLKLERTLKGLIGANL